MSDDENRFSAEQELNEKILSTLQGSFSGEETKRWMAAMKEDKLEVAEEIVAAGSTENSLHSSMTAVMDRLFDNFKRYSFDFNRLQENRDYEVTCERPTSMRMTAEYMERGKPIKFCLGHLSSKDYSLIVQGEEVRIRVFIVPIEYMVGFKPGQTEFTPYIDMKLAAGKHANETVWKIGNETVAMSSLPAISRRIFTQLIKVTKGEANFDEKFLFNPQEHEEPKQSSVDRSFEDDDASPLVKEKNIADLKYAHTTAATAEADFFQSVKSAQAQATTQPPTPSPLTSREKPSIADDSSRLRWQQAVSTATAAREASADNGAATATPPSREFFNATAEEQPQKNYEKDTADISRNVARSIKQLFDTVDASINSLTQLGVEAMHADDIDKVSEIMRHAKTLKNLREGIVHISKEWQKSL